MATTKNKLPKKHAIEYICTYCGAKRIISENLGRPDPGTCLRKGKGADGKGKPHSWRRNRII